MRACGRERQGCLLGVLTLLFLLEKKVFSYEGFYNGVFCAFYDGRLVLFTLSSMKAWNQFCF